MSLKNTENRMEIRATLIGSLERLKMAKTIFEGIEKLYRDNEDLALNFEIKSNKTELNKKVCASEAFNPLNWESADDANNKNNQP